MSLEFHLFTSGRPRNLPNLGNPTLCQPTHLEEASQGTHHMISGQQTIFQESLSHSYREKGICKS